MASVASPTIENSTPAQRFHRARWEGRSACAAVSDETSLLRLCFVQCFSLIYLQKFAIPLGATPISLLLVIQLAAATYLVAYSHAVIDVSGLLTFLAFTCLCLLGQAQSPRVSWPSLLQLIVLNATLIVVAIVPPAFYKKVLHLFHELAIVPAVIVFAQRLLLAPVAAT